MDRIGRKELTIIIWGCWALKINKVTKEATAAIPRGAGAKVNFNAVGESEVVLVSFLGSGVGIGTWQSTMDALYTRPSGHFVMQEV